MCAITRSCNTFSATVIFCAFYSFSPDIPIKEDPLCLTELLHAHNTFTIRR